MEIFRRKVTSLFLDDADGVELRDITQFNAEFVENLDVAMAGFIGVLPMHVRKRKKPGGVERASIIHHLRTSDNERNK